MLLKVLAVDDEVLNLEILTDYLESGGYEVVAAENAKEALDALKTHSDIGLILLDRMMPGMDGLELLRKLKADESYKNIPVIMQTAASDSAQVREGMAAGAYYYLTKPYKEDTLLAIVQAAWQDLKKKRESIEEVTQQKHALGLMQQARFQFQTPEEAHNLACFIAGCFPDPEKAVGGLIELAINAVEHGNLKLKYDDKKRLTLNGQFNDEIEKRLSMPEYKDKKAVLDFHCDESRIEVVIRDEGEGFDWVYYMQIDPRRVMDPNGRGIALTAMFCFDELEYLGDGNTVRCVTYLAQKGSSAD